MTIKPGFALQFKPAFLKRLNVFLADLFRKGAITTVRLHALAFVVFPIVFLACANIKSSETKPDLSALTPGERVYFDILTKLNQCGDIVEYDLLMEIYNTMVHTEQPIPRIEHLLDMLVHKRNDNPRVDQMILIFSAKIIGKSRYPIPDVREIFQTILTMSDDRINAWVISYVGAAIGGYRFEIPNGDELVDLLDERLDQVKALPAGSKEYFGFHFLPPPKSEFIRSYIAGIRDKRTRETERAYYYALIMNRITEKEIEAAVKRLQTHGLPDTGKTCSRPMRYLISNLNRNRQGM